MSKVRIVLEAAKSVHPMAVHAYPSGGGKFTVHATGSKVQHVKKGDTVSSSDLDDLSDAGHKVKEVKKPVSESMNRFEKQGEEIRKKRAEAARALADADEKTRERAKKTNEEMELDEAGMPSSVIKHKQKLAGMTNKELASHLEGKSEKDLRDMAARHGYGWNKQTKTGSDHYVKRVAAANEEVERVNEKLTPEAKSAVKQALGPKTPGNEMRKSSKAARTLITVLKTNKKNVAEAEDASSVKQKAIQKYIEQGYSYNDAVKKAEIYLKKKKLM